MLILEILQYLFFWIASIVLTSLINRTLPERIVLGPTRFFLERNMKAKTYDRLFKVKLWKHKLPQLSSVDKSVYDKSKVKYGYQDLLDYKLSLEKGVFAHSFPLVLLLLFLVLTGKPAEMMLLNCLLMIIGQFPFVLVQVYNHVRILKVIEGKKRLLSNVS